VTAKALLALRVLETPDSCRDCVPEWESAGAEQTASPDGLDRFLTAADRVSGLVSEGLWCGPRRSKTSQPARGVAKCLRFGTKAGRDCGGRSRRGRVIVMVCAGRGRRNGGRSAAGGS
jgi:hypothetical protein